MHNCFTSPPAPDKFILATGILQLQTPRARHTGRKHQRQIEQRDGAHAPTSQLFQLAWTETRRADGAKFTPYFVAWKEHGETLVCGPRRTKHRTSQPQVQQVQEELLVLNSQKHTNVVRQAKLQDSHTSLRSDASSFLCRGPSLASSYEVTRVDKGRGTAIDASQPIAASPRI